MLSVHDIRALATSGRYREALELASTLSTAGEHRLEFDIIRAELLERTGDYISGRALLEKLLRNSKLKESQRARCELTLGVIEVEDGRVNEALMRLQRASSLAERSGDAESACLAQLRIAILVAQCDGPIAAMPIMSRARMNATKAGNTRTTAALHILVGQMEAKRGIVISATRHVLLGQKLLAEAPQLWLQAFAENTKACIAIITSDFRNGLEHAERARELAVESGAIAILRAAIGNLGNLHCALGQTDAGIKFFKEALEMNATGREERNASLDSLARAFLLKGETAVAEAYLMQIEQSLASPDDRALYENRYSKLTKAEVLRCQGRPNDALDVCGSFVQLAELAGDHTLALLGNITRAEISAEIGAQADSLAILADAARSLPSHAPDVHALYERAQAVLIASGGRPDLAAAHINRARRIYKGLRNTSGELELDRVWNMVRRQPHEVASPFAAEPKISALVQDVAAMMLHFGRPEVTAIEVASIIAGLACAASVKAGIRRQTGEQILYECGCVEGGCTPRRSLEIGSTAEGSIFVSFEPHPDTGAHATLNAITILVETLRQLERGRMERDERLAIWPDEDEEIDDSDGVILGRMRDVMVYAKRVAKTNIAVLITGESGTGKEILARAVHKYSTRAEKPFMPFNCTAIPHDMLESQLFGHRRGAFTSADRDNPGLIRAAQGGTLFLDEIGELGLDLQPKLLRFLESGEISPLGEIGPVNVDVRIIAATNRNLEDLVRAERFREDLFYRLNVIRLTIPPLRERRDEIPVLVHHFVAHSARDLGKGQLQVAEETMERFLLYQWPGNVRQLQNEIRRIVALAEVDGVLTPDTLTDDIRKAGPRLSHSRDGHELAVPLHDKLGPTLALVEREMIRAALKNSGGRLEPAAKALGISRKGLYLKRQRLGV